VQLDANTFGAVFGYTNAVGGTVTLGVGARNQFSGGQSDLGQPILFVPGQVPIASFQRFPVNGQLTWTLGLQSAKASGTSPLCAGPLGSTLTQLYTSTSDSKAVLQLIQNLLSNPRFPNYLSTLRTRLGTAITPFQSALLDAMDVLVANADLVADAATLSATQLARLPAVRAALLSNAAVGRLRLAGDAMRGQAAVAQCNVINAINREQPLKAWVSPQAGSLFSSALALANSTALQRCQTTVANALAGSQSAAILGAPGLLLAGTLPLDELSTLDLAGPIPTSLLGDILSTAGGAIVGGVAGFIAGGPGGAVAGAIAGGIAGHFAYNASVECDPCGASCNQCSGGCCGDPDNTSTSISGSFLIGSSCGSSSPCSVDSDCGASGMCVAFCCSPRFDVCPGDHCTTDADCSGLNTCQLGCCTGPCGRGGTTCNVEVASACGVSTTGCSAGEVCQSGCCQLESPPIIN